MTTCVAVWTGAEGRAWQRHTFIGRPHPSVQVLRRRTSPPSPAEEEVSSGESIGLVYRYEPAIC